MEIERIRLNRTIERTLVSRDELSRLLNMNPDSLGRLARGADGLAAALVRHGGSGRPAMFDVAMALQWFLARQDKLSEHLLLHYRDRALLPIERRGLVQLELVDHDD
jgi:hypothetical protein